MILFIFLEAAKLNAPTPGPSFLLQTTTVLPTLFQTFPPTAPGLWGLCKQPPCPLPRPPHLGQAFPHSAALAQERLCRLFVYLTKVSLGGVKTDSTDTSPHFRCPGRRPGQPRYAPTAPTLVPTCLSCIPRPQNFSTLLISGLSIPTFDARHSPPTG